MLPNNLRKEVFYGAFGLRVYYIYQSGVITINEKERKKKIQNFCQSFKDTWFMCWNKSSKVYLYALYIYVKITYSILNEKRIVCIRRRRGIYSYSSAYVSKFKFIANIFMRFFFFKKKSWSTVHTCIHVQKKKHVTISHLYVPSSDLMFNL